VCVSVCFYVYVVLVRLNIVAEEFPKIWIKDVNVVVCFPALCVCMCVIEKFPKMRWRDVYVVVVVCIQGRS